MNLRAMVNRSTSRVNPNIRGELVRATGGYTTAADGTRTPNTETYAVTCQVQGLSGGDLKHIEGLNIEGVMRSVHVMGQIDGPIRVAQRGGDQLVFTEVSGVDPLTWNVVAVMETWRDWSRVIVALQS